MTTDSALIQLPKLHCHVCTSVIYARTRRLALHMTQGDRRQLTSVVCVAVVTLLPPKRLSSSVMAFRKALSRRMLLLLAEFPGETLQHDTAVKCAIRTSRCPATAGGLTNRARVRNVQTKATIHSAKRRHLRTTQLCISFLC